MNHKPLSVRISGGKFDFRVFLAIFVKNEVVCCINELFSLFVTKHMFNLKYQ